MAPTGTGAAPQPPRFRHSPELSRHSPNNRGGRLPIRVLSIMSSRVEEFSMASAEAKLRMLETVVSAVLVTIGILGLLAQTKVLVIPLNLTASLSLLKWWPLALVGLGTLEIALYGSKRAKP
jgi:hypothetical protein